MALFLKRFLRKTQDSLNTLRSSLIRLKANPTEDGFYQLGKGIEALRDHVGSYLNAVSQRKRPGIEDLIIDDIRTFTTEVSDLTTQALEAGSIPGSLAYDVQMMSSSLLFVSWQSRFVVDRVETRR